MNTIKSWNINDIKERLFEINSMSFISIDPKYYRKDDGIVGQLLEKLFYIEENNLSIGDLGNFELKGMRNRKNKSNLTLGHQKPTNGMSTKELFDKYGYIKASKRDASILKKKLFTTIKGNRYNNLGLALTVPDKNKNIVHLYHKTDGYLSTWELDLSKVENMVLVYANTSGIPNSLEEQFHFIEAYLYQGLIDIMHLIDSGLLVMDLCIDQPADMSKTMHDRGPHWRIPTKNLPKLYKYTEKLL